MMKIATDSPDYDRFSAALGEAQSCYTERNKIIHGVWLPVFVERDEVTGALLGGIGAVRTKRWDPGLHYGRWTVDELRALAQRISAAGAVLDALMKDAISPHTLHPDPQPEPAGEAN